MYADYFKRVIDFCLAVLALVILSPLLIILIILGFIMMGGNPFFTQIRPGKDEKLFRLIKFRTMDNRRDKDGKLLPDSERLNGYGRFLRSTSLDELPELLNIIKGDMAIVGPRPQLVRDMVFMSQDERRRHAVRQGLTGLAQINGRNNMSWERKFSFDLQYIDNITFIDDLKIILTTFKKVFKRDGINADGEATALDYGDYLLKSGKISREVYDRGQDEARELLDKYQDRNTWLLYKKNWQPNCQDNHVEISSFQPKLNRLFIEKEKKTIKLAINRVYFILLSHGNFTIYYIKNEFGKIIHTSYVVGKTYKFPFMKKHDFEIGPCFTIPTARGKGLYQMVLQKITTDKNYKGTAFYMLVHANNLPSVAGIKKSGFTAIGNVSRSKILKVYRPHEN